MTNKSCLNLFAAPIPQRRAIVLTVVAFFIFLMIGSRREIPGTSWLQALDAGAPTSAKKNYNYNRAVPPCSKGWVLPQISRSMQTLVEEINAKWYDALPGLVREIYNVNLQKDPVDDWRRFDVMMPALPAACPSLIRVGGDGDGGKLICGLENIPDDPNTPCIVYSIGSNNNWAFEEEIVKITRCKVFTFDCTVDGRIPEVIQDRVSFYPLCVGSPSKQDVPDSKHKSLRNLMEMLGHDHITLLKADIEGYEYDLFSQLLSEDDIALPEQISFELHYGSQMTELDWHARTITMGELAFFARSLYDAGYRVISREDNKACPHCAEFTVVQFRCPAGPRTMQGRVQAKEEQTWVRSEGAGGGS